LSGLLASGKYYTKSDQIIEEAFSYSNKMIDYKNNKKK